MSEAIRDLVQGVVDGSLSDDELTDWLRGVYDEGLAEPEIIALTEATRTRPGGAATRRRACSLPLWLHAA